MNIKKPPKVKKLRKTTHDDVQSTLLECFILQKSQKGKTNKSDRIFFIVNICFMTRFYEIILVQ